MFESFALVYAEYPWFFRVCAFVFGACCGSFFNVVIYRFPAGKSVVHPRSHCACGALIPWYDNLPVLSWFLLGGKARCCGGRFSFRYPMVELVTGFFFMACWWLHPPLVAVAGWVFMSLLIIGSFVDYDTMELPNFTTVGGMLAGVLLAFAIPSLHGYGADDIFLLESIRSGVTAMIGAIVGSGTILWIAICAETVLRKEAMGFGDVLLMGCVGAFCGWEGALFAIFGGALLGTIVVLPLMLLQKLFGFKGLSPGKTEKILTEEERARLAEEKAKSEKEADVVSDDEQPALGIGVAIPFGPWLAAAGVLYFLFFQPMVDEYLASVKALIFQPYLLGL